MKNNIQSENIRLIAGHKDLLIAALNGNSELAQSLGVVVPDQWSEFGEVVLKYALEEINKEPSQNGWWMWFPVLKECNLLIGSCGYKGKPVEGIVEIGYEVIPSQRRRGYATEIASALIHNAFNHKNVHTVQAHTLAEENASTKVLKKCGLNWTEELEDEEDGTIWKWAISRDELKAPSLFNLEL
ncbi:MAG: N-acetyltransferase [Bacteroidetes bacterium]|nr:MAG: N-acetyltransferase [Bacteroidota bacterium]